MTTDDRLRSTEFDLAAALIASRPGALQQILAVHRPRSDGRCTGCFHLSPRWPCTLAAVAQHALRSRMDRRRRQPPDRRPEPVGGSWNDYAARHEDLP